MDKITDIYSADRASEIFKLRKNGVVEEIELREMSAGDRDKIMPDFKEGATAKTQARLVAICSPNYGEDRAQELLELPAKVLDAMATVVIRLSGLEKEDDSKKE